MSVFQLTRNSWVNHEILSLGQILYASAPLQDIQISVTFDHYHGLLVQTRNVNSHIISLFSRFLIISVSPNAFTGFTSEWGTGEWEVDFKQAMRLI